MSEETVAGRRLHPASALIHILRQGIGPWVVPAAVAAFGAYRQSGGGSLRWAMAIVAFYVVWNLGSHFLSWYRFRYGISETDIVLISGIINRNRRVIPLARIHDLNIEQGPVQRMFGVVTAKIETGGGKGDEGALDSITVADADRLRAVIRGRGGKVAAPGAEDIASPPLFVLSARRLAFFGLFNFSLFYLAGVYAVFEVADDWLPIDFWNPSDWRKVAGMVSLGLALGLVGVGAFLGVVLGAGRTFLREYNFTLVKDGARFKRTRGLLTRSEVVIPIKRVQLAKVRTKLIRKALGWYELSLQTLGGADEDQKTAGAQVAAPFARLDEVSTILGEVPGLRLPTGPMLLVSRLRFVRIVILPVLFWGAVIGVWTVFIPLAALALVLLPLIIAHAWFSWRLHRYALEGDLLFLQRGVLNQRLAIIPVRSSQVLTLQRGPIQQLLGLATLRVDTAGGSAVDPLVLEDLREETARALLAALGVAARLAASPPPRRARALIPQP